MTRSKTLLGLLIALTLVFSLPMTANGAAELQAWGDGEAVWTTEKDTFGIYSAKLTTTVASWDNIAQVKVLYNQPLDSIEADGAVDNLSFWIYVETSNNPYPVLYLDTLGGNTVNYQLHGNRVADITKNAWVNSAGGYQHTWIPHLYDASKPCGAQDGTTQTIADWNTEYPDAKVIYVALQYGNMANGVLYADDITINDTTYAVEPGTPFKLVWTTQPEVTKEAGVDITTGKVSVQAADPDSGLIDTTDLSVTVKAYRADNDLLSDGLWDGGTVYNTVGISKTTTSGVATFGNVTEFDFSKVGTYKFRASSSGLTSGNSNNVVITYNTTGADMKVTLTTPATMEVNTNDIISALVKDEYGNIVTGGVSVKFHRFAPLTWGGPYEVTSLATGYADSSYTSGTSVLIGDSVEAYVTAAAAVFRDTSYIALTPGALATIGATPPDYGVTTAAERVVCDSLSGPFNVDLQDAWGNHIDAEDVTGKKITIGTIHGPLGGGHTDPALSGAVDSKVWSFKYIGGDTVVVAGTDTIPINSDKAGVSSIEVYARVIGGPIAEDSLAMTLTPTPPEVIVIGDSSNTITCDIVAKDKYGNLTENREITFGITGRESGAIGAAGAACKTDVSGAVAAHDVYLAGSKATVIYLTASATDGEAIAKDTIYLEAEQGCGEIDSIAITGANSVYAGQETELTFTYFDGFGNEVDILFDATPDTTFANLIAIGTLGATTKDTVETDTLVIPDDAIRAEVYGVRLKKDYTGEPLTVSAVDTIVATANSGTAVDTLFMNVIPAGALDHFALTCTPDTIDAGTEKTVTIIAVDTLDNQLFTYTNLNNVILTLSGSAADPSQVTWLIDTTHYHGRNAMVPESTFVAGACTVKVANEKAETDSVIADMLGISGTSNPITWKPTALDSFGVVAQEDSIFVDVPFSFTVIPYDEFLNVPPTGLPRWIEFSANESGVSLPTFQLYDSTTVYSATASNPSDSLQITVATKTGLLIYGISDDIIVNYPAGIPEDEELPIVYSLKAPDLGSKTIQYAVPERAPVSISLFDKLGRRVGVLVDKTHDPGYYEVHLDRVRIPSGVYFIKMESPSFKSTKKMLLLK